MRDDAHLDIGRKLAQELDDARCKYDIAVKKFNAIMGEVSSGLPFRDGALLLQQIGRESRHARELCSKAVDRYSNFLLYSVIPDDFKRSGAAISD